MSVMASQITSLTIADSTVYSGTYERKYQSSALLAFMRGIHRWLLNFPHKGPVTRKMFSIDDVIMICSFFRIRCLLGIIIITSGSASTVIIKWKSLHKSVSSQEPNDISNHRQLGCLSNSLFKITAKKPSKSRVDYGRLVAPEQWRDNSYPACEGWRPELSHLHSE